MSVNSLAIDTGPSIYYDPSFRNVLEDHWSILRNSSKTTMVSVDPMLAYRYEYSFYALLNALNIPTFKHWITLRLSGFRSPSEPDRTVSVIYVPSNDELSQLAQSHLSSRKMV